MSKHRKPKSSVLTAALLVGGFVVLGVFIAAIALAQDEPDPLDRPDVVPGGLASADFAERVSVAQATSRDQERLDRYKEQLRQERVAKRQLMLQEARKDARREARQEAADQAQDKVTPVVVSEESTGGSKQTTPSGGLPALLLTIRAHESGGNYSAYNAGGCEGYGCGGAYQMHAAYAAGWAAEAGYPGMSGQAQTWDPAVQDAVALYKFYATNPDGALWCDWVDYC